jgi:hypothetical protein
MVNNTIFDVEIPQPFGTAYGTHIATDCVNFDGRNNIVNRVRRGYHASAAHGVYGAADVTWEYNDVYDVSNNLYTGGITAGIGCISANPMFVSTTDPFDFNLQTGSPCIDSGDPDPGYNDTDNSQNDMGCYGGPEGDW